ncbi:MAG: DNA adenine methylase, partial [bacterium]|nr:DNA adenine methylase [bacterium]
TKRGRLLDVTGGRMSRLVWKSIPCPIPYQGSKRRLASAILSFFPEHVRGTLIEPFAGSAAISLAAALTGRADRFLLCDLLRPLVGIWRLILEDPERLAHEYETLWTSQLSHPAETYYRLRTQFNQTQDPSTLLYLLARCVKNAVRFNPKGEFNQSPDHRRGGMRPSKMRREILTAHRLLKGRTTLLAGDYSEALRGASREDLVYMDPPYQGVSNGRDRRYLRPLDLERFVHELGQLNRREVPFIISFDGRRGEQTYGDELPRDLHLKRVWLEAGRSSQATLLGRDEITIESLYVSPALMSSLERSKRKVSAVREAQQLLLVD